MKRYYKTKKYYDKTTNTTYDSKLEYDFDQYLKTNYPKCKVRKQLSLELIPKFKDRDGRAVRKCEYKADFVITDNNGNTYVIDIKPNNKACIEEKFKIKWKLAKYIYKNYYFKVVTFDKNTNSWIEIRV
ncbi:MAG: DUF1064 domain-containing protein [Clostridium butyricum]|nr:DUF1064 domain-containing protein [Clostridium butyricum]